MRDHGAYLILSLTISIITTVILAAQVPGDALRGAKLFRDQDCVVCHAVNGRGGASAPDLGKAGESSFGPAELAGMMWHHAPKMWDEIEKRGIQSPRLNQDQTEDLFAFLYLENHFRNPGQAKRGQRQFRSKRCVRCHGATPSTAEGVPAEIGLDALIDPIALAHRMWNHQATLQTLAPRQRKRFWSQLDPRDLSNILAYLITLLPIQQQELEYNPASAETGETLFRTKGCQQCHSFSLANRYPARTPADFAAAMWNHASLNRQMPALSLKEMRAIIGYLWTVHFFDERGDEAYGKKVFVEKRCAACHASGNGSAPPLDSREYQHTGLTMGAALSERGLTMMSAMKQETIPWPSFQGTEMADLIEYLNSIKWLQIRER